MIRQSLLLFVFSVLLIQSCEGKKESRKVSRERVLEVKTVPVKFKEFFLSYRTNGYLEAVEKIQLRPLVSGRVIRIYKEEGERVSKGEILFKIEDKDYRLLYEETLWSLEQARREYENQRDIYKRRESLYKKELISREEFESIKTKLEVLEAKVKSLEASLRKRKTDLDRTEVRAPFEGYILKRLVSMGDLVGPDKVCYEIVRLSPLRFVFKLPQEVVDSVKKGMRVDIDLGGRKIRSRITYISPSADENRMFTVKALVENKNGTLKPQTFGEVSFRYKKVKVVAVPENAVQLSRRRTFVWVVRDSRAVKIPVSVVGHKDGVSVIMGKLREGDRIVVENAMFLKEGVRVREG